MSWLLYALLSGLFIGSASFFRKMATKSSGPLGGFIIEGLVYGALMLALFLFQQNKSSLISNPWYAAGAAVSLFFGAFFLYRAFSVGELSLTVISYLVVSFIVVLLASFAFLKEPITLKQGLGIIIGIVAIFLLQR